MNDRIIIGDALQSLKTLPDESVHCVVTSPPYWGLRDYGVAGQLGREKTPEVYIAHMIGVFGEVKRVLRSDGTLWCNMGDSYASGGRGTNDHHSEKIGIGTANAQALGPKSPPPGLKPKDLCMIPARLALALQAAGWWLRSDIIWAKPNLMPESVTDRPTKSHEYVFLLTKSANYYFDQEAVREGYLTPEDTKAKCGFGGQKCNTEELCHSNEPGKSWKPTASGRNLRDVWTIPTEACPEAHFATFPRKLVEPCVKAGSSERGVCPECRAPWVRIIEKTGHVNKRESAYVPNNNPTKVDSTGWAPTTKATNRWRPSCSHGLDPVPATVLDPFAGTGTVGRVARDLGRNFILIELNPKYLPMIEKKVCDAFCRPEVVTL